MSEGRYGPQDAEVRRAIALIESDRHSYMLCVLHWHLRNGYALEEMPADMAHSLGRLEWIVSTAGRNSINSDLKKQYPAGIAIPLLCLAMRDRLQWIFQQSDFDVLTENFRTFATIMEKTENDKDLRLMVIDLLGSMPLEEAYASARRALYEK